ncbi:MAG: hypothetical protein AB7V45_03980 [Candidatus Krumholzibacteriia bacterium]
MGSLVPYLTGFGPSKGPGGRFLSELENGKPTIRLDKVLTGLQSLGLALSIAPADPDIHQGEKPKPFREENGAPGGPKML